MRLDKIDIPRGVAGLPREEPRPRTPEEAARQFEEVLVKQMVREMTKGIFDNNLTGDDAPQWMGAYSEMQSDVLTTELAKQLTDTGKLGISELLIKQWKRQEAGQEGISDVNPTTENNNE
jgi:flagellar protein FlgJ